METLEKQIINENFKVIGSFFSDSPSTELQQIISGVNWADSFTLGAGVDAITGELTGSAIDFKQPEEKPSVSSHTEYSFIRSEKDMEIEFEAALSGKYNIKGIDVSASTKFLNKITYNELTMTVVAKYVKTELGYNEIQNIKLTKEAQKYLKQHPEEFRNQYGDYFVTGSKKESKFIGIYQCKTTSASNMAKFSASLDADRDKVFSAKGSASFYKKAKENNVNVSTTIYMIGQDPNVPQPPANDPILEQLEWFKNHEVGSNAKAKLASYSTIDTSISRVVNIAPETFVQLGLLYFDYWKLMSLFDSCPSNYKEAFEKEFEKIKLTITAEKRLLPNNIKLIIELDEEIERLVKELNFVYNRMIYYFEYLKNKKRTREPRKNETVFQTRSNTQWVYGEPNYSLPGVEIRDHHIHKTWNRPIKKLIIDTSTEKNQKLIVAWRVVGNLGGKHTSHWIKNVDHIIGNQVASIDVYRAWLDNQDYKLTIYTVDQKDYAFDDLYNEFDQLEYPNIAENTPVDPNFLGQIINLPPGEYNIVGEWHYAWEVWAYQNYLQPNPNYEMGCVAHFNIQQVGGPMLHVYYNAYNQLQIVHIGQRPNGY